MCIKTKPIVWLFAVGLFVLGLLGIQPAAAQVREATSPIVVSRIRHIAEMIPGSHPDLPPYLAKS